MNFANHLKYEESYHPDGEGVFFWLTEPIKEEQRTEIRETLPESVRSLFDKMQLDCPDHIIQYPIALFGDRGILVSYIMNDPDVSELCDVEFVGKEENRAVFEWLNDVAAKAKKSEFVEDYNGEILVSYRTTNGNCEFGIFIPEEFCVCRGMMEEVSNKLREFVEDERKNSHCIYTISGRTILFRTEDDVM